MTAESLEKNNAELLSLYKQAYQDFDKQVIYIAGGGLALSIGFVKDIVKVASSGSLGFLMGTWAFLACTLLLNLISYMVSSRASNAMLESNQHMLQYYAAEKEEDKEEPFAKALRFHERAERNSNWVKRLNLFSIVFTAAGIGSFLLFVSLNLASMSQNQTTDKPHTSQPQGPDETKGTPLPHHLTPKPQAPTAPVPNQGNQPTTPKK